MQTPRLQGLIHQLYDELEIDLKPTANEKNEYTLDLMDNIELYLAELEEHAFLRANLLELPKEKREDLFTYLMELNFLGQGTGDGGIGIDEKRKFLTVSFIMPYEVNFRLFKEKIEDYVNYVFYLRDEITTFIEKNQGSIY